MTRRPPPPLRFWDDAPAKKPRNYTATAILLVSACLILAGLLMRYEPSTEAPSADEAQLGGPVPDASDNLSAQFALCDGPARTDCVVDGDTFWFAGDKIRIADINTPETSTPECDAELALGKQATQRLRELLNAGPFSLSRIDRDTDRYGRKLRILERGGQSLGSVLVSEGLAEDWKGYRSGWC